MRKGTRQFLLDALEVAMTIFGRKSGFAEARDKTVQRVLTNRL